MSSWDNSLTYSKRTLRKICCWHKSMSILISSWSWNAYYSHILTTSMVQSKFILSLGKLEIINHILHSTNLKSIILRHFIPEKGSVISAVLYVKFSEMGVHYWNLYRYSIFVFCILWSLLRQEDENYSTMTVFMYIF